MKQQITYEQMIAEIGEPPICACSECQKTKTKINVNPKNYLRYKRDGYPKFTNGHQNVGKIFTEEHKNKIGKSNKE